jgi:hypothetical protein
LREEFRLVLGKFEHVGVEVADGFLIGKVTGMRWDMYDCGIYVSLGRVSRSIEQGVLNSRCWRVKVEYMRRVYTCCVKSDLNYAFLLAASMVGNVTYPTCANLTFLLHLTEWFHS